MAKIPKPFGKQKKTSSNKLLSTNVKSMKSQKGNKNGPEKLVGKVRNKDLFRAIKKDMEENGELPRSSKVKKSESHKTGDLLVSKKKRKSKPKEAIEIQGMDQTADDMLNKYKVRLQDIESAIDGVIKFHKENPKMKNQLFDGNFPLSLTVNCHKIPRGYSKLFRVPLKNSLLTPDDDVCLITSEVKGIGNKEHDKHIEHYENLLATKGVTNIKKIMTFHEFRTEHETFEQKSRLADLYDVFLVCGKISGKVVKKCGSIFYKKRKVPIPVKLQATKLKTQIDQALSKSFFHVHLKGDSYNLQFGNSLMEKTQLIENLQSVLEFLDKNFPGGFDNIKGLHVYAPRSTSIPVFVSTKSANELGKITTNTSKQQPIETCRGELTTLPNAEVIVKPSGQVFVKRIFSKEDEPSDEKITDEDIIKANKEEDEENKETVTKKKKKDNAPDVRENKVKKGLKRDFSEDAIQEKEDDENGNKIKKKTRKRTKENSSDASNINVTKKVSGKKAKITEEKITDINTNEIIEDAKKNEGNITKKNRKSKVASNTISNSKAGEKTKPSKSIKNDAVVIKKQKANRERNGMKASKSLEDKKKKKSKLV